MTKSEALDPRHGWEVIIGLEVHVQLATTSKLFSDAPTQFGAAANTQASLVDLGFPGVLPVVNEQAIEMAVCFGLAVNATINSPTEFARKNYFYPDLPKGYQISQMDTPIISGGTIPITLKNGDCHKIHLHHAHLEEDAGKSLHDPLTQTSKIDLNRAGIPLLEIVSNPDFRNAEEVVTYLKYLNNLVRCLKISDGDLSQGSMRCDVNISVRRVGDLKLGIRTEIKNLNSYRFIEQAILYESQRHIMLLSEEKKIKQETRLYNPDRGETASMRSKEDAQDYRYFPCPDLLPVVISQTTIDRIRNQLPPLPEEKLQRYQQQFNINKIEAKRLADDPDLSLYFEQVLGYHSKLEVPPKTAANWILGEIAAYLNQHKLAISEFHLAPKTLAELIATQNKSIISGKGAKVLFAALCDKSFTNIKQAIKTLKLQQISDAGTIETFVDQVIHNNPEQVANYKSATEDKKKRMIGFFTGQVMKLSKGSANPSMVTTLLQKKLT